MPSGSTRLTEAFLYSFPLIVLKSSASVIDADSVAKIASVALFIFARACQIPSHMSILKMSPRFHTIALEPLLVTG
jgi:hypothetical protein